MENIFVLAVILLSGGFLGRRLFKIGSGQSDQSIGGGCAACKSCGPNTVSGETPLLVKTEP